PARSPVGACSLAVLSLIAAIQGQPSAPSCGPNGRNRPDAIEASIRSAYRGSCFSRALRQALAAAEIGRECVDIFARRASCAWPHERRSQTLPRRSRLELPANLEPVDAWREIRAELRRVLGESTYSIWIAPLEVKAFEGSALLLNAPPATQAWVAKRFGRILETCASAVLGQQIRVAVEGTSGRAS